MISPFAIECIEKMERDGLHPTPRDIVRLNALGLKVERGDNPSPLYSRRRCAFVGDAVLREPTIATNIFISERVRTFSPGADFAFVLFMAWALSFDEPPRDAPPDAIMDFTREKLRDIPARRVAAAVDYCLYGCDSESLEYPARKEKTDGEREETADDSAADELLDVDIGIIHRAEALSLGISLADAMRHTRAQLNAVVRRALEHRADAGDVQAANALKREHDRYEGEFYATLDEIRARLENERAMAKGNKEA